MVCVIKKDVTCYQVRGSCEILGVCQACETCSLQAGSHIAGVCTGDALQLLAAKQMTSCLNVGNDTGRAVSFTCCGDLRGIIAYLLQFCPVGLPLILVIADLVIIGCLSGKICDAGPHCRIRMPLSQAYDAPAEAVPLPLAEGRISGGFVIVYPPDSPLVIPGELYTADVLEDIRFFREAGCTVSGIEEETVPCVIRE